MGAALQPVGHAGRRRSRRQSGVPIAAGALKRVKATAQQVGLSRTERAANIQGAFRVPAEGKAAVAGRRLVLVDDVLTSGATVEGCARALLRAGAANVDVLVFARVAEPGANVHINDQHKGHDAARRARYGRGRHLYEPLLPLLHDAKELLSRKGVEFHEIDVTGNGELRQQMIERANGRTTFPQIFIGATHVGGCDDLYALEEAGKLDPLLATVEERPA